MDDSPNVHDLSRTELIALLATQADGRGATPETSGATASDGPVGVSATNLSEAHAQRAALGAALIDIAVARDELAARQLFTDALLETIDVGIVSCAADGSDLHRNTAERTLLGLGVQHAGDPPDAAASLVDVMDATGERLDPQQYPLARTLRGEAVGDTDFRIGPRGGPYRDVVIRGSRITTPDATVLGAVVAITDVTAERTALRELATERERLSQAQRLGQFGSFEYEMATGQFTFSAELLRIWGVAPDADLAALRRDMIHPDDVERVTDHWQAALNAGGEHGIEYRIVRPDGALRHLRVSLEARLDPAGHAVSMQGTHLDITDLTVARLEAVEANALFAAILAATPDYTFVTDIWTGALVYGSPSRSVLGRTTEQLTQIGSARVSDLVHSDDLPGLQETNLAARDLADRAVLQVRYRARHSDGSWRWLDRRVTPFRRDPATGQVVEVLGVARDVTDEHQTELALRDQEARLRALVTQVVDYAIVGLDPIGNIESWNDGAERLKGYTTAQAIGQNFSIFYTADDRAAGAPSRLLEQAQRLGRVEAHGWRVRANGSKFWADVVITALHDDQGLHTGFVKVTRDLTAQHQLEKARESLFATVSHDLKTPITAIKLFAEMMSDVSMETQAAYARRIATRADELAKLVDVLFEYATIRAAPMSISLEPLSLATLAKISAEGIGPMLSEHRLVIEETPLVAWADRAAMSRILDNLLSNAAKYSPAGSPVTVAFAGSDDLVRVSIRDQGRGIAPEDIDTIFVEFNRGRLAENDGGTGLGLASVQRLTSLQGGRTWVESELGRGTTVTVELARAPDAADLH